MWVDCLGSAAIHPFDDTEVLNDECRALKLFPAIQ